MRLVKNNKATFHRIAITALVLLIVTTVLYAVFYKKPVEHFRGKDGRRSQRNNTEHFRGGKKGDDEENDDNEKKGKKDKRTPVKFLNVTPENLDDTLQSKINKIGSSKVNAVFSGTNPKNKKEFAFGLKEYVSQNATWYDSVEMLSGDKKDLTGNIEIDKAWLKKGYKLRIYKYFNNNAVWYPEEAGYISASDKKNWTSMDLKNFDFESNDAIDVSK